MMIDTRRQHEMRHQTPVGAADGVGVGGFAGLGVGDGVGLMGVGGGGVGVGGGGGVAVGGEGGGVMGVGGVNGKGGLMMEAPEKQPETQLMLSLPQPVTQPMESSTAAALHWMAQVMALCPQLMMHCPTICGCPPPRSTTTSNAMVITITFCIKDDILRNPIGLVYKWQVFCGIKICRYFMMN
ncbi:unnamed protein product [Cuscuta epithymum]|uniref:Uncharacterized protein n=1 Tax=Cuscuta epithymum TaxID=186058 RepID=A0AAV0FCW1_9ASTE|nr:unnamed protein product [Cuscuta epithymum]